MVAGVVLLWSQATYGTESKAASLKQGMHCSEVAAILGPDTDELRAWVKRPAVVPISWGHYPTEGTINMAFDGEGTLIMASYVSPPESLLDRWLNQLARPFQRIRGTSGKDL